MAYLKIKVSIFAVLVAATLVLASPLEFATAQETLNSTTGKINPQQTPEDLMEQCVQEGNRFAGECVLEARDPMLPELEADEAAADQDSGSNQVIDKLSSMNSAEAMKFLLELQTVEKLKDLKTLYMETENQTAS
jgi:hypothetical protein